MTTEVEPIDDLRDHPWRRRHTDEGVPWDCVPIDAAENVLAAFMAASPAPLPLDPRDDALERIRSAWRADTSADPMWSHDNPALGQCAVTALVVQDRLGGDLLRTTVRGVSHYLNRLPDGSVLDLTLGQFHGAWYDAPPEICNRDYVLGYPATAERYAILAARLGARSLMEGARLDFARSPAIQREASLADRDDLAARIEDWYHEVKEAGAVTVHDLAVGLAERIAAADLEPLRTVAEIVRRHTHQGIWAMTAYAGDPEHDCHLCRALVAAGVLTLDGIGAGTRAAILDDRENSNRVPARGPETAIPRS